MGNLGITSKGKDRKSVATKTRFVTKRTEKKEKKGEKTPEYHWISETFVSSKPAFLLAKVYL